MHLVHILWCQIVLLYKYFKLPVVLGKIGHRLDQPRPAEALSDGPNAWPLERMESLLNTLIAIDRTVKEKTFEEEL